MREEQLLVRLGALFDVCLHEHLSPGRSTRLSSSASGAPTTRRFWWRFFHHGSGKWMKTAATEPGTKRGSAARASSANTRARWPKPREASLPSTMVAHLRRISRPTILMPGSTPSRSNKKPPRPGPISSSIGVLPAPTSARGSIESPSGKRGASAYGRTFMAETSIDTARPDVARQRSARVRAWLERHAALIAVTSGLAIWSIRGILRATGGEPAAPLDDTFIHFQYARSFAELTPFQYTHGAAPTPGATSLLWPLLLSVPYALGLRDSNLLWAAWTLSWTAMGLLAHETYRAGQGLLTRSARLAAGAMVLTFGGYVWFASSGMEVVPLAWLLMRSARRAADFAEGERSERTLRELLILASLASAMRPEGALAAVSIAVVIAGYAKGLRRLWSVAALTTIAVPGLVNLVFTGQGATTTAEVKWLPFSPYQPWHVLVGSVGANVTLLFDTLLDGRIWSAVFLPSGIRALSLACVPALLFAGLRRNALVRALLLTAVALGMLIPTTYDSFLWNRLRYLWPFAAAWFVGAAALADAAALLLARFDVRLVAVRPLLGGGMAGALAAHLPFTLDDLAESSNAIRKQQVSLGRWARDHTPENAVLGVNDTGAIAYFSNRRVFDVVGLTTRGESRYWAAGAGSRFEHYERLGVNRLPTHFIVYPEWFALPPLLGTWLTERRVPGATILGGETMSASMADWSSLKSAELPLFTDHEGRKLVDTLDVADVESERAHDYDLLPAVQSDDVLLESDGRADGARRSRVRDRFRLELAAGGLFVARLGSETGGRAIVKFGERVLGEWQLAPAEFREYALELPELVRRPGVWLEISAQDQPFTSLHYWSFSGR